MKPQEISNQKGPIPKQSSSKKSLQRTTIKKSSKTGNNLTENQSYKAEIQKKKMTDEMLGKLKDMGNSILGKFGLSLNNFQMTPNGQGGYSIQYNNNK